MLYLIHVRRVKADQILAKVREGQAANPEETDAFGALIMYHVGQWVSEKELDNATPSGTKEKPKHKTL